MIKIFNTEKYEIHKYETVLKNYLEYNVKSTYSFALLNFGQGFIFSLALMIVNGLCVSKMINQTKEIQHKSTTMKNTNTNTTNHTTTPSDNNNSKNTMTLGEFILMNSLLLQLSWPLNFLGTIYRELIQSAIDMKSLFCLLDEDDENNNNKNINNDSNNNNNNINNTNATTTTATTTTNNKNNNDRRDTNTNTNNNNEKNIHENRNHRDHNNHNNDMDDTILFISI